MKIMIIGAGVVGTATGEGFSRMGRDVIFFDTDPDKTDKLKKKGYKAYSNENWPIEEADIYFICVEEWNVDKVFDKWHEIFKNNPPKYIIIRSTVSLGTTEKLRSEYGGIIVHNPEFLRERDALYDFIYPNKIVIGRSLFLEEYDHFFKYLYKSFNAPIIFTDSNTSEFLKLASNAVLSSYISTWNQLKLIADAVGINSHQIAKILTLDPRISKYGTIHGKKFGGFCLPKDLETLIKIARENNVDPYLLVTIKSINKVMPE